MIEEIRFLHQRLTKTECLRIIMLRDNWEIRVDKTDLIGEFNGTLRIVRADGRITSVNPSAIALVCTQRRGTL